MSGKKFEIRCPVHGFIELDDWERDIINTPEFQRLRRIRQLGLTDYIYPGATHTRFEHSLGAMHVASRMYESIAARYPDVLKKTYGYNEAGLKRDFKLVRLTALLHDIGHAPLSHSTESLMPDIKPGEKARHEDYSASVIRHRLKDVIEDHYLNKTNYKISAEDVASMLDGTASKGKGKESRKLWVELLDGQMDADRMDYLLRDSLHAGVRYGHFDLDRIINTICICEKEEGPNIGATEGGWHALEGLVFARYYMFTQVYFHKTRVAYDYHTEEAMRSALPNGRFPLPNESGLKEYMKWDDWFLFGLMCDGKTGEHGRRILERNHYRLAYETDEVPTKDQLDKFDEIKRKLSDGKLPFHERTAARSWYNPELRPIPVLMDDGQVRLLSDLSAPIKKLHKNEKKMLYVEPEKRKDAKRVIAEVHKCGRSKETDHGTD
ncbi:MAG: HD domain-containing protein [Planctomycetota bacterium]|nr:HD domain-containing protein [Planctomycetota bacterium]